VGDEPARPRARIRAETPGYLVAGDVGQPKVAEHEVEALLVGGGEPVATGIGDCYVVASAFQQCPVSSGQVDVVFDDERAQCCWGLGSSQGSRWAGVEWAGQGELNTELGACGGALAVGGDGVCAVPKLDT